MDTANPAASRKRNACRRCRPGKRRRCPPDRVVAARDTRDGFEVLALEEAFPGQAASGSEQP
jgi:hypothetical protein